MTRPASIAHRLIAGVLLLELVSALALITSITLYEYRVQLRAFDARLEGSADTLMGAVQDAEDVGDNVMLDLRGIQLPRNAIYLVHDERGRILGSAGILPPLSAGSLFPTARVNGRAYRFFRMQAIRIIDPGEPGGGVRHTITIVFGIPVAHVWHEVLEEVRFIAFATLLMLGLTALLMTWLIRRGLSPLHALALEAERIDPSNWQFTAPPSARNTAELRPLASVLEATLARLQRSFEQQRRFTSDAAHELKTDLAIVKSSLQLLVMKRRTADEYSHGLARGLDDFTRLESTVQKMLTLARLEQPDPRGPARPCSLRDVLEESVIQSRPLADLKSISIRTTLSVNVRVPIDRRDALLLCSNILLNALQHSAEGSLIRVSLSLGHQVVRLTVQDRGEGIAPEDLPHLFEPFYRGDLSRSRKSGGTGLGLSICKAICDRVGGSIEIQNLPEGGALVQVCLPVASSTKLLPVRPPPF